MLEILGSAVFQKIKIGLVLVVRDEPPAGTRSPISQPMVSRDDLIGLRFWKNPIRVDKPNFHDVRE
jgi:hypothetical protein